MSDLLIYIILWGSSIVVVGAFVYFLALDFMGKSKKNQSQEEEN